MSTRPLCIDEGRIREMDVSLARAMTPFLFAGEDQIFAGDQRVVAGFADGYVPQVFSQDEDPAVDYPAINFKPLAGYPGLHILSVLGT